MIKMVVMVFALAAILTANAEAQGKKGFMKQSEEDGESAGTERLSIRPSGLAPLFPSDAACPEVASPFASLTRYDGSFRPSSRYGGLHGGMDLSLDEGLRNFDPVAIYLRGLKDLDDIESLPDDKKRVAIPYISGKGLFQPAGSKVVWPVRCR